LKLKKLVVVVTALVLTAVLNIACSCSQDNDDYISVAQLLDDPVYNSDIAVWGEISLLGELFCPCFKLTSGGQSIEVWYGLMVEDDGTELPPVSVEGFKNGDKVIVVGQLKPGGIHHSENDFWAKSIKPKDGVFVKNADEALREVVAYLNHQSAENAPPINASWAKENITPDGLLGSSTFLFTSEQWQITVSYPIVLPENTIYEFEVVGYDSGWYWQGSITAKGQITENITFSQMTLETSRGIARDIVVNSPTFKYDGIEETLALTEEVVLRCPFCWQFVYEFDSSHAGYGDRTGQVLAQVITHHRAVITIDHGRITRAVMDDCWDMLNQQEI